MADDLVTQQDSVAQRAEPLAAPAAQQPAHRPVHAPLYGKRFAVAYAFLAVALGAGVGLAVVLLGTKEKPAVAWSEWKPRSDGATPRIKEIAEFVSQKYRLASGAQAVGVVASPLAVETEEGAVRVTDIAIRTGSTERDVVKVDTARDSWMFTLCGLGERCAIAEGEPTEQRGRLLRRQALELALYSFRYIDGSTSVVAFMPPRNAQSSGTAVYLRRDDLAPYIERPLSETLLPLDRLTPDDMPPGEEQLVDQLTRDRLFLYEFRPGPSGGPIMVLLPAL